MNKWKPIETAPKGKPFLALNHDKEVWVAKYSDDRLVYRHSYRQEPKRYEVVNHNGEELLREDKKFAEENEKWQSAWVIWSRLFEFNPTHWAELPSLPK